MKIKILMYEDAVDWKASFERLVKRRLAKKEIECVIDHKVNTDTAMQDLQFPTDLVLIDCDLGVNSGEDVLKHIQDDPDFRTAKLFFYSGGVPVDELKQIAANYNCGFIRCSTKDDLEDVIAKLYGC